MMNSTIPPRDDHYQHCTYNQTNLKKRIRYYTPQPSSNESRNVVSVNASFSKLKITSDSGQSTRDSGCSRDQRSDSEVVTCFKSIFEPSKVIQGALRTQSLLRRCYTPNPGFEYRVEIVPKEEMKAKKQLPELPNKILTSDRYHSDSQNILKQFSSLSKAPSQNCSLLGLKKPIKQRPKLDLLVAMKNDSNRQSSQTNNLSPAIASKAETESKNFLYDMYLKRAEDSLEEFENKKEVFSLPECLRQLDRSIEFYELALKTLGGDKTNENSRILLRVKQSQVILKKRHIWRIKNSQRPFTVIDKNGKDDTSYNEGNAIFKSSKIQKVDTRTLKFRDERPALRLKPFSAAPNGSLPVSSGNSFDQNYATISSVNNDRNGYQRSASLDNAYQPGKIKVTLKGDLNNLHRLKSNPSTLQRKTLNDFDNSICLPDVNFSTSTEVVSRRKLPLIPEFKIQESIDTESRHYANEHPFVKISLV